MAPYGQSCVRGDERQFRITVGLATRSPTGFNLGPTPIDVHRRERSGADSINDQIPLIVDAFPVADYSMLMLPWLWRLHSSISRCNMGRSRPRLLTLSRRRTRLQGVEQLEDRVLLSAATPSNLALGGPEDFYPGRQILHDFTLGEMAFFDANQDGFTDAIAAGSEINVLLGDSHSIFEQSISIPLVESAHEMVTGDMNEDGLTDLVILFSQSQGQIWLGQANGGFEYASGFTTRGRPTSIKVADLNGDEHLDLAMGYGFESGVSLHFGDGQGQLEPLVDLNAPRYIDSLEAADINRDGNMDLLIESQEWLGVIQVRLGTGVGEFEDWQQADFVSGGVSAMVAQDMNDDGFVDLIVGTFGGLAPFEDGPQVAVLTGDGDGGFAETARYATHGTMQWTFVNDILIADVDADGQLDVVAADARNIVSVALAVADGEFGPAEAYFGGSRGLTFADVNGDATPDLITNDATTITILQGIGDGQFAGIHADGATFQTPTDVRVADFNSDGFLDRLTNFNQNHLALEFGDGAGQFSGQVELDIPHDDFGRTGELAVADINGDERPDIVASYYQGSQPRELWVYLSDGTKTFSAPRILTLGDSIPTSVTIADINADGRADIIAAVASHSVQVLLGDTDYTFAGRTAISILSPAQVVAQQVNGDALLDVVIRNNNGALFYAAGIGGGEFATPVAMNETGHELLRRDLNEDGFADLAYLQIDFPENYVVVAFADGHGGLLEPVRFDTPSSARLERLDAGDADGDGHLDLVVSNNEGNLLVLLGNGSGGFAEPLSFAGGALSGFDAIAVGDFNSDGRDDVTFTHYLDGLVPVLLSQDFDPTLLAADLRVTQITVQPTSVAAGSLMQVQFTVQNQSDAAIDAGWIDTVYLSTNQTWDSSDVPLARIIRESGLAAGSQYTRSVSMSLPFVSGLIPGQWHIVVRTDSRNQVPETDNVNNVESTPFVVAIPVTPLQINVPVQGEIQSDQALYFQLDSPPDRIVALTLTGLASDGVIELYVKRNGIPTRLIFDASDTVPFSTEQSVALPYLPGTELIYVMVVARSLPQGATSFELLAETRDFTIRNTSFGAGGNAGDFTLRALGTGFETANVTVRLKTFAGFNLAAHRLEAYPQNLYSTFDLRGVAPGVYDVEFTSATGEIVTVAQGLTVVNASSPAGAEVSVVAPSAVRRNREFVFTVEWFNPSLNDVLAPLLTVGATMPFGPHSGEYSFGTEYTFLATSTLGGPAGVLRPGQRESLTFWAFSPLDVDPNQFNLFVDRDFKDLAAPFDWDSQLPSFVPAGLAAADMQLILTQIADQVGPTARDYLGMLSRNAALLPVDNRNPASLFNLEFAKAWAGLGASIIGRVGPSIPAGALVEAWPEDDSEAISTTLVLNDGSFVLPGLIANKTFNVRLRVAGAADSTTVQTNSSVPAVAVLELVTTGRVWGTVSASGNALVPGATVTLVPVLGVSFELPGTAITDALGAYEMPQVTPGRYKLLVQRDGYADWLSTEFVMDGSGESVQISAELAPGSRVSGTLADAISGAPLEGSARFYRQTDNTLMGVVSSTPSGTFTSQPIPAGLYRVESFVPGYLPFSALDVLVEPNVSTLGVQLRPNPVASLTGVVVDQNANAVTGVLVQVMAVSGDVLARALTDAEGRYRVENLGPGSVEIIVGMPGQRLASVAAAVDSGESTTIANLVVNVGTLVQARVVDQAGQPISDAAVQLTTADGNAVLTLLANELGEVAWYSLTPGDYWVAVSSTSGSFTPKLLSIPVNNVPIIQEFIAGDATISGTVTLPPNAEVKVVAIRRGNGDVPDTVTTSVATAAGTFALSGLVDGVYEVYAATDSLRSSFQLLTVSGGDVVSPNLTLNPRLTITGSIADAIGNPIATAWVFAYRVGTGELLASVNSDEFGGFVIDPQTDALVDLVVVASGEETQFLTDLQGSANEAPVTIVMSPSTRTVSGSVASANGEVQGSIFIQAVNSVGRIVGIAASRPDGTYQLAGLTADQIHVSIFASSAETAIEVDLSVEEEVSGIQILFEPLFVAVRRTGDQSPLASGSIPPEVLQLGAVADLHPHAALIRMPLAASAGDIYDTSVSALLKEAINKTADIAIYKAAVEQARALELPTPRVPGRHPRLELQDDFNLPGYLNAEMLRLEAEHLRLEDAYTLLKISTDYYDKLREYLEGLYTNTPLEILENSVIKLRSLIVDFSVFINPALAPFTLYISLALELEDLRKKLGDLAPMFEAAAWTLSEHNELNPLVSKHNEDIKKFRDDKARWLESIRVEARAHYVPADIVLTATPDGIVTYVLGPGSNQTNYNGRAELGPHSAEVVLANEVSGFIVFADVNHDGRDIRFLYRKTGPLAWVGGQHTSSWATVTIIVDEKDEEEDKDDEEDIERPTSFDPNDIIGPAGAGPGNHIVPENLMPYTIRFENDAELATAPAASVRVTQQLDTDLDWTTFRLGDFGIGDLVVAVPDDVSFFETRLDLIGTRGVYVDVTAGIDVATGIVYWELTAVDPATGDIPEDPLVGFLPPNLNGPEGEGFVTYTVRPDATVVSGDRIDAVASIVFDVNEPIVTPAIFHTFDTGAPTSSVQPLSPTTFTTTFAVSWTGTDELHGAGIATFDVYVSDNGGSFTLWQSGMPAGSAAFTGLSGHSYAFYSVARDLVGHQQVVPSIGQASTTISMNSAPAIDGPGEVQFVKNQVAAAIAPGVELTDAEENLGGGTLRISMNDVAIGKKKKRFDMLSTTALNAIGTVSAPQFAVDQAVFTVVLQAGVTAAQVADALRSVTFSTSAKGLKVSTRTIKVNIADTAGASDEITRTIRVLKKAPRQGRGTAVVTRVARES